MMDCADRADLIFAVEIGAAIIRIRSAPPEAAPVGYCLSCDAPLPLERRWCDAGCRDDWQAWVAYGR